MCMYVVNGGMGDVYFFSLSRIKKNIFIIFLTDSTFSLRSVKRFVVNYTYSIYRIGI